MSLTGVDIPLILYGPSGSEANVFGLTNGQQPTPYASVSQEMIAYGGNRWGQSCSINLEGKVTGVDHGALVTCRSDIINNFSNNQFGRFIIRENNQDIFTKDVCKIENINFASSQYSRDLDYTISIRAYDPDLFTGTYGVLEPVNKIDYQEQENGQVKVTHTVSAKGFNTSANYDNAFENAYNYVKTLTGLGAGTSIEGNMSFHGNSGSAPHFVSSGAHGPAAGQPLQLNSVSESVDRLNGSYSVTENYTTNRTAVIPDGETHAPMMSTNCDIKQDIKDDFKTVSIDVSLQGGLTGYTGYAGNFTESQLRAYAKDHVLTGLARMATALSNVSDLHTEPISTSISMGSNNDLKIQAVFDNNPLFDNHNAYFDYTVSINKDHLTDMNSIKVDGEIIARGNLKQKFFNAKQFFVTGMEPNLNPYLASLASGVYTGIAGTCHEMNPKPESVDVREDSINGKISVSASFNDKDFFGGASGDFVLDTASGPVKLSNHVSQINYNWSIKASMPVYKEIPSNNKAGLYMIYDGDVNTREEVAMSANAVGTKEAADMDTILTFLDAFTNNNLKDVHIDETKNPIVKSFEGNRNYSNANTSMTFSQEKKHETFEKEKTKIVGKYIN